jgi:hypothetical protein
VNEGATGDINSDARYDDPVRTTIDIPPLLHRRIKDHAAQSGQTFTATATEALMRGMEPITTPPNSYISPVTGLMVFDFQRGHQVTPEEVADIIDEDRW